VRDLRPYHDECAERCREHLGDRSFQKAFDAGVAMRFEEAVAYALGKRRPAPQPRRATDRAALTPREHEVAGLIARGMSNKEIAKALVIATRTAESHVENILAKLGSSSRTQIVSWVAGQPVAR
jgi:DNA-binding NarL/FixJ family response regulator